MHFLILNIHKVFQQKICNEATCTQEQDFAVSFLGFFLLKELLQQVIVMCA